MNRPVLNFDTLLLVLSLANSSSTKLALMSTCRILYREGGKLFLRNTDVNIKTEEQLLSFLQFMNADGFSRMRYLRSLNLNIERPSGSSVEQLKNMFIRLAPVSQLESFDISHPEQLLSAHPPLSNAICQLTSIKEIGLYGARKRSFKMLGSMRSKFESVSVREEGRKILGIENTVDGDVIHLLRRSASSLRKLYILDGGSTAVLRGPQYPFMHFLSLSFPGHSPVTWHYVRAFPNLKILWVFSMDDDSEVGSQDFRESNVSELNLHGCWESLDTFVGTFAMLWHLGLSCPIHSLELTDDLTLEAEVLRDVLSAAHPIVLDATFYAFSNFFDPAFTTAFSKSCAPQLERLTLTIQMNTDEFEELGDDMDLGTLLDIVTDMLCGFGALKYLCLCIDFAWVRSVPCDDPEELFPAEVDAEDMVVDEVCSALRDAVPSATEVQFTLKDHKTRETVTVKQDSGVVYRA